MSNHSPDENQAVTNAAAKKPRTAVGLPSDSDRHYDLDELRACGFDAMAATVVHHIAYNTKRHKCAKAYTSSYWMEFFGGCSKKQARTAVKNAMAATMNDVPLLALSHGYFNGVWSPHYLYVGPGADLGTPHADLGTPCTEGNQQKETQNLNIQNAGAGNTPASTSPEKISEQSGKDVTPKKEQASEPFLKISLSRKLEFIEANDNGENTPCVLHELTDDDRSTAQRLEHELTKAGLDPLGFMKWLTLHVYQKHMLGMDNAAHWSLFVIMTHREMFFDRYKAYLVERAKYSSGQQLALTAIAPKELKIPLPLYEENPGLVAAMFGHADYWRAEQTGGLLGGKTLPEYLAGWQWTTPEMMGWLDNEAVRERVEELLGVHDAAAA
ncbi:hypothetical protein PQQ59_17545 [Paraburkholderia aspalathi]|uniref:hypothetical protein n=1 Tax=Paraburkholderia aspalathi TaxID=1324617 RepID=UPI0038B987C0